MIPYLCRGPRLKLGMEDDGPSPYTHNFQIVESSYYNLALLCHSLNLPRPFLYLVTWRIVFRLLVGDL
jgi:hypothetical protein